MAEGNDDMSEYWPKYWREALIRGGLNDRTAVTYSYPLARISRLLGRQRATTLANCSGEDLAAVAADFPDTWATRRQVRSALEKAAAILDRPLPLDAFPVSVPGGAAHRPLGVEEVERFERTAWAVGGLQGLTGLLLLHTDLTASEACELTWADIDLTGRVIQRRGSERPIGITPRLRQALAEHPRDRSGFLFPKDGGHLTARSLQAYVRAIAGWARLPSAGIWAIQRSEPGEVNVEEAKRIVLTRARTGEIWAGGSKVAGIGLDDLVATGLADRSARVYLARLRRVKALLDERGTDLMACTGADLAAIARCFPNNAASRGQLRGAVRHAWEALGREHPPALTAIRIPSKPRGRSKALPHESAQLLEQTAWDRDDIVGLAVLFGLYGTLRRAEIASLTWECIELDPATGQPEWMRITGKGDVTADVPIHPVLAKALLRFRRGRGYVFPGRYPNRPVNPATIWSWTKTVGRQAGLENVYTHLLRHTALTEANDATNDLRTVQQIARHSRPEITAIYTRVTGLRMTEVVAAIDYGRNIEDAEPDPARGLPGVGYREAVAFLEEGQEAAIEAWIELGVILHPARWRCDLLGRQWWHPEQADLGASASAPRGVKEWTLTRYHLEDDTSEVWDFDRPKLVLALADALHAGLDAPVPSARLGPWIEQPFREWLRCQETTPIEASVEDHGRDPEKSSTSGPGRATLTPPWEAPLP